MKERHVLKHTLAFILGFVIVFSVAGIILQTILSSIAYTTQSLLAKVGGIVIIALGLHLLGLFPQLSASFKINIKRKRRSVWISFLFGVAFALGWSPCYGAVLGAVLTLAVTQPSLAFILLLSYALGLSIPFLLVGLYTEKAKKLIRKKINTSFVKPFGAMLVVLGIMIFLNALGNITSISSFAVSLDQQLGGVITIPIAFLGGIISILSPCTLPLLPIFLTYLATIESKQKT